LIVHRKYHHQIEIFRLFLLTTSKWADEKQRGELEAKLSTGEYAKVEVRCLVM
jgi:hypothetical protein